MLRVQRVEKREFLRSSIVGRRRHKDEEIKVKANQEREGEGGEEDWGEGRLDMI